MEGGEPFALERIGGGGVHDPEAFTSHEPVRPVFDDDVHTPAL